MIHKQRLNNRILSVVLALVLVLSMLPMASLTAFAADAGTPSTLGSSFFANGTDLFVDAGTSGGTAVYYYEGNTKVYLNANGAAGDTFNGNSVFIYAGGYTTAITADVTITVLGGSVGRIYSAGDYGGANIIGNVTIKQLGEQLKQSMAEAAWIQR